MSTQYDAIADMYAALSDALITRPHVEQPSFFAALGAVEGKKVLDLACGTGMYSRMLKQRGASQVVGVDIAAEMIEVAKHLEEKDKLGIEYLACDVAEVPPLGSFDVVTAAYLLHYAQTKEHLLQMCRGIYKNLKPGGRFVTLVANPEFDPTGPGHAKYGFTLSFRVNAPEGSTGALVVLVEPPIMIHAKHWSRATYTSSLAEVGFKKIVWGDLAPSPEAEEKFGREFWQDFLRNPHARIVCCEA